MTNNLFDFNDVSDLPAELADKLVSEQVDRAEAYVNILKLAAAQDVGPLDINQIIAVAIRQGIEVPAASTVRNYLNAAKDAGLIVKPTRQSYAIASAEAVEETSAPEGNPGVAQGDDDPLADL